MDKKQRRTYRLSISFAAPQRKYATDLCEALKSRRVGKIFLCDYEQEQLAGTWLPGKFEEIFRQKTDRPIILLSKEYLEETRRYTRIEAQASVFAMHDRIAEGITPPLFLVKFDDVELPGYNPGYHTFDARTDTVEKIAEIIAKIVRGKKNCAAA